MAMNYSTAVFLINHNVRCISALYNPDEKQKITHFKTLDKSIQKDDLIVVPTDTRVKFTVVQVLEVDIDFDPDSSTPMQWAVQKLDKADYDKTLAQENTMIATFKAAELRQKREDLAKKLIANHMDSMKTLEIADMSEAPTAPPQTPLT